MVDVEVHINDSLASLGLLCIHIDIDRKTEVTVKQFQQYITVFSEFLTRTGDDVVAIGEDLGIKVVVSPPQWFPLVIDKRVVEKIGITMRIDPAHRAKELVSDLISLNPK